MLTYHNNTSGRGLGRQAHSGGGVVDDEKPSAQTAVESLTVGGYDLSRGSYIQFQ